MGYYMHQRGDSCFHIKKENFPDLMKIFQILNQFRKKLRKVNMDKTDLQQRPVVRWAEMGR